MLPLTNSHSLTQCLSVVSHSAHLGTHWLWLADYQSLSFKSITLLHSFIPVQRHLFPLSAVFSIWHMESNLSAREFKKCRFLIEQRAKTSIQHLSTHACTPAKDGQRLHIQPAGRSIRRRAALGFRARPRARLGWIASDCAVKSGVEFIRVSWRDFAFSEQLICIAFR